MRTPYYALACKYVHCVTCIDEEVTPKRQYISSFYVTNDRKRIHFTFTVRNQFCIIKLTQFEALVLNTIPAKLLE